MLKGVKASMSTSSVSFFLWPFSGEGAAHDDRLHLSAGFCDSRVSRHAHCVAWAPPSLALLAGLHASRLSRAQDLGRDGPVDARRDHRVALWPFAQSHLLECASAGQLAGAGSLDYLAAPCQWHPVSVW